MLLDGERDHLIFPSIPSRTNLSSELVFSFHFQRRHSIVPEPMKVGCVSAESELFTPEVAVFEQDHTATCRWFHWWSVVVASDHSCVGFVVVNYSMVSVMLVNVYTARWCRSVVFDRVWTTIVVGACTIGTFLVRILITTKWVQSNRTSITFVPLWSVHLLWTVLATVLTVVVSVRVRGWTTSVTCQDVVAAAAAAAAASRVWSMVYRVTAWWVWGVGVSDNLVRYNRFTHVCLGMVSVHSRFIAYLFNVLGLFNNLVLLLCRDGECRTT